MCKCVRGGDIRVMEKHIKRLTSTDRQNILTLMLIANKQGRQERCNWSIVKRYFNSRSGIMARVEDIFKCTYQRNRHVRVGCPAERGEEGTGWEKRAEQRWLHLFH